VTTGDLGTLALWIAAGTTTAYRARIVARGSVVAATTSATLGLLALVTPLPGSSVMVNGGRVRALFQDPNVFGPFLVPAALILLEEAVTPRLFRLKRSTKVLLVILLAVASLLSYSRGAWANLAVGAVVLLLVLALRRGGGRKVLAVILGGAVAAVLVGSALNMTGQTKVVGERAHLQSYDADRFGAQRVGIELAQRYPLGVGPGQFERSAPLSAHSTYIRVLGEQGLPGLIVFLAFAITTLGVAVANAVAGRGTYGIGSAALLGAWSGLLVNSFVIDTLHWRYMWLIAALIWAGWARRKRLVGGRRSGPSP
jgi:O-antigen ligase